MGKTVTFSDKKTIIFIPYEDRKGEWMTMALDRYRFQRGINHVSKILNPILEKNLQIMRTQSHIQNLETHNVNDL